MSSKDTWTCFKRRVGFGDFCENQNVGIKMHCKTAGVPSQVRVPKIMHTVTHCKAKSPVLLPHLYPGAMVQRSVSTYKPSLLQLLLAEPFKSRKALLPSTSRLQIARGCNKGRNELQECRRVPPAMTSFAAWPPKTPSEVQEERSDQKQLCANFSGANFPGRQLSSPEMVRRFERQASCNPKSATTPGCHRHSQSLPMAESS